MAQFISSTGRQGRALLGSVFRREAIAWETGFLGSRVTTSSDCHSRKAALHRCLEFSLGLRKHKLVSTCGARLSRDQPAYQLIHWSSVYPEELQLCDRLSSIQWPGLSLPSCGREREECRGGRRSPGFIHKGPRETWWNTSIPQPWPLQVRPSVFRASCPLSRSWISTAKFAQLKFSSIAGRLSRFHHSSLILPRLGPGRCRCGCQLSLIIH